MAARKLEDLDQEAVIAVQVGARMFADLLVRHAWSEAERRVLAKDAEKAAKAKTKGETQ